MRKWLWAMLAVALIAAQVCLAEAVPRENWEPHGEFSAWEVTSDAEFIYAFECGGEGFGFDPPYRTTVYDADGAERFTIDGYFCSYWDSNIGATRCGLEDGYGVVAFSGGSYGIVSDAGVVLINGLRRVSGFCGDFAYYSRDFDVPLLNALAEKLGWETGICGRIDRAGNRFEVLGNWMYAPDEEGYFLVETFGGSARHFGYLNSAGKWAIAPVYAWAHPFVDGAAVVKKGEKWMLIDREGAQIGDLCWTWSAWTYPADAFRFALVPVEVDGGIVLYDRSGNCVSDVQYASVFGTAANGAYLLCVDASDNLNAVDATGAVVWRGKAEEIGVRGDGQEEDQYWLLEDGLWREVDLEQLQYTGDTIRAEDW